MRFFKPTGAFWSWTNHFYSMPVIDVGCGDGSLVREMQSRGLKAIGIDPRYTMFDEEIPRDLISSIIPTSAEELTDLFDRPVVILCCRPCHSGFPGEVARIMGPEAIMYYIGFRKNLEFDLGGAPADLVLQYAGESDEGIWKITKPL